MHCPTCEAQGTKPLRPIDAVNLVSVHGPQMRAPFYSPCGHQAARVTAPCKAQMRGDDACALSAGHAPPCVTASEVDVPTWRERVVLK